MQHTVGPWLAEQADALGEAAHRRLADRPEFAGRGALLAAHLRALAAALARAVDEADPQIVTAAALHLGREETDPCRSYGRLQLLLDLLCVESAELARRQLPTSEARAAARLVRDAIGPAMIGLGELCRVDDVDDH